MGKTRTLDIVTPRDDSPQRAAADLLLLCGRSGSESPGAHGVHRLLAGEVDWAYLLWLAHRQGMLPLLHGALRARGAHPAAVAEQLATHFAANTRRNAAMLEALGTILALFQAHDIPALPLRVPFLLARVYSHPGERQFEPLDILVAERGAPRAQQLLAARDFQPVYPLTPRRDAALRRTRAAVLHHPASGLRLHLHDRIAPAYFSIPLGLSDLWQRRQMVPLGSAAAPFPSTEDLLLLLCVHGALHLWGRLAWVADLARLIEACRPLAWPQILDRARAAHAERMVLLGLALAHDLLSAALPEEILKCISADPIVHTLAADVRRRLFLDLRGWTGELERMRFRLRARPHLVDRLRYWAGFALMPTVEDWQALALPDPLFPLYHLVRPLRLAALLTVGLPHQRRAPFMQTPMPVLERMLALAGVQPADRVYDLGCGDGRIVIAAAQRYGARGVGVDLDPARIEESRANARRAGVDHLVEFVQADALAVDLRPATVVTLWMLQTLNFELRPKLRAELPHGARIVGHSFDMGDWIPTRTELVPHGDDSVVVYLWANDRRSTPQPSVR